MNGPKEILLTSVDNEGLQNGMDLELIEKVSSVVSVPVIFCGGVGSAEDIIKAANKGADAIACASILHYEKDDIPSIKKDLIKHNVEVRQV